MAMDLDQLAAQQTIDLTTVGRRSGRPRRIEIWWFRVDGRFIITGTPGKRDWLANVHAHPGVTVHVAGHDLAATATPVDDVEFRRHFFRQAAPSWYSTQTDFDHLLAAAPMVEITFDV